MRIDRYLLGLIGFFVAATAATATADVRVSSLIGDNMVLQQGVPVRLWGRASPGETVRISIAGHTAETSATPEGAFQVSIGPLPTGGPYTLDIVGKNALRFENVLVGEVWIASGQSNMEFPLARSNDAEQEIAAAHRPGIRFFTVQKTTSLSPQDDVKGSWVPCSPETARDFSAVAFFFGRSLLDDLDVPIGLIHASWGGTPAEAWTSRQALTAEPTLRPMVDALDRFFTDPALVASYERALTAWESTNVAVDPGNAGEGRGFARIEFDDSAWETAGLPTTVELLGHNIDGAVWFRRSVEIPEAWAGKDLVLHLGAIDDYDETYFGGVKIGSTGRETPGSWARQRVYRVPGELVKAGANVVAVRVFDRGGEGGFTGPTTELELSPAEEDATPVSLSGAWRYHIEVALGPFTPDWGSQPVRPDEQNGPTTLFNAMIAPLTPLTIRGVIWYQGESNADRAAEYRLLFPIMIRDWRRAFGLGDFPFYFVQLANYMARADEPTESEWAELREAQLMTLGEPQTGMAVAIDVGEADDIHPRNKQDVGRRLALWALARTYGRSIECSGPLYRSHEIQGDEMRIAFDHAQDLTARDGDLVGFAVAGEDRVFTWASARIEGESVVVRSPSVPKPIAVRYGWADNPRVNLYNGAGLPASPFRTDDWPRTK
jgi:sialate O-acetylesterase